ncbi:MAG: hypothetical protein ACFE9L_12575 [Candidatus Hodarchaeota archaeon]
MKIKDYVTMWLLLEREIHWIAEDLFWIHIFQLNHNVIASIFGDLVLK